MSHPANATEEADYLRRIDDAVAHSGPLQQWLQSRSSQVGEFPSKETKRLLGALQDRVAADCWMNDPSLVPLLPIVLRAAANPEDLSGLEPWYRLLLQRPVGWLGLLRIFYYPFLVGLAALSLLVFFSVFIIPTFVAMYDEFELRVPNDTKLIFALCNFLATQTIAAVGLIALGIALAIGLIKFIGAAMDFMERSRLVGFLRRGNRKNLGSMARWSGALSELLAIGTPAALAVTIAGIASQRTWLRAQSRRLALSGAKPPGTWSEQRCSRSFARSAIAILDMHSESGEGSSVLRDLAQSYAVRWCNRPRPFYGWVGPVLLLMVAALVMHAMLAIFMPMLSLVTSLSR
ncbi:MAG: hypothetical protein ACK5AC_04090 [Planctomycetota bacterium]|jgi:hypothetical protein